MPKKPTVRHIKQAVKLTGGQAKLAAHLDVTPGLVSQWVTGRRPVAANHCIAIEGKTDGKVTRYALRPDVFGPAPDRIAA